MEVAEWTCLATSFFVNGLVNLVLTNTKIQNII